MRSIYLLACLAVLASTTIAAADRVKLGFGRISTNDLLGDGKDRWRTGSFQSSWIYGAKDSKGLPTTPGALLELRLRAEVMAPANLVYNVPNDRRYTGALSVGVHSHWRQGDTHLGAGVDLVLVGPQTGMGEVQQAVHKTLGQAGPDILASQTPNAILPTLTFTAQQDYSFGTAVLRPIVELRAGDETLVRVGADVLFGGFGTSGITLRDGTTGMAYETQRDRSRMGWSGLVGFDRAYVYHSTYLRAADGVTLSNNRTRLRAGVNWQGKSFNAFYGITALSPEFDEQSEGQLVGAFRIGFQF